MGAIVGRDNYFDSLKFVLISLVVVGHLPKCCLDGRLGEALTLWIYLFHMPLFIFVSGYFTKKVAPEKFKKGIIGLLETYLVYQALSLAFGFFVEGRAISFEAILSPGWTLWYLLSLITWRCVLQVTPPII